MQKRKKKSSVILSWILSFSFLLSVLSIPVNSVKAATSVEEIDSNVTYAAQTYATTSGYNFAQLLQESLYLYDANMCGSDVNTKSGFTWRTNCHTGDAKITYNGKTYDLSGGYHDAGDHVKFGLPQAYSASVLGLAYYQFKDAFKQTGSEDHYIRVIDRFVEYFEKCTILDSSGKVTAFCYQVGDGNTDHSYWGAPEEQEKKQGQRKAYFTNANTPATDVVCETAAALAIYYCNFKDTKPTEAKTALNYAEKLFAYANGFNNKKTLANEAAGFYDGSSWQDDYALAAAWLYKATNNSNYKTYYNNVFGSRNWCGWVLSWDDVSAAALLYGPNASTSASYVSSYINSAKNNTIDSGKYVFLTNWGSARYNAALQFMGLAYDSIKSTNTYGEWAEGQMNYLLGTNPGNKCFVVGYNSKSVKYPHHRAASGYNDVSSNATTALKHTLVGALVGGPDSNSSSYKDSATNYATNEVALDYNAGLVGAAAGLYLYEMKHGTSAEKAAQVVVDETKLTSEMRTSVVTSKASGTSLATPKLSAVSNEATGVKITWGAVSGAAKYRVYYKTSGGSWTKIADTTSTSYTWTGAKSGTTYTFTVRCLNSAGTSFTSSYDSTGKSIKYIAAPKLSAVSNEATGVKITWGAVSGAELYRVYYKTSGGSWTKIADTTSTSYTWTGAKSGTTYTYTVRCLNSAATVATSSFDSTGKTLKYVAAPKISAVSNEATGVKITWGAVSGAELYRVYYKTSGGSWTKIADTTSTSYTWTGAKSGTTYTYTVRCLNSAATSFTSSYDSTGKTLKYVAAPKISAVSNEATGVKITWGAVTGAELYRVYYKTSGGSWTKIADTTATSYTWTGAASGTTYTFTVRCLNSAATSFTSSYDSTGKSILYLSQPKISKIDADNSGVNITWGKVTGATTYRVYYKSSSGWVMLRETSETSCTINAVKGNSYQYTVKALNGSTASSYHSGTSFKRLETPVLSGVSNESNGVKISWGAVNGAEKYRVYYKTGSGSWTKIADTTSTSYTWTEAKKGTTYTFTVRCLNSDATVFTSGYDTTGKSIQY